MSELGSLLTLEYGEALPAEVRSGYGFPVFGSNGEVGRHRNFLVHEAGIVVGRKGSVGKITWSDEPFWPIDTTYWVNCAPEDKRWIYWILSWLPLARLDTSTGVPGLNRNDVYALCVDRPRLIERQLIAQLLDTLDTAIHETEAIIAKLKAVKQGLLHDLLTRGIDANGELRPPQAEAPHLYKESPLGWIPKEWEVCAAEDVCEAVIDCKNRTPPEMVSGHPVIRTPNIRAGRFVRDGLLFTDTASYAIWTQRGKPRVGDVLITREAPVGEVCLLPADIGDACLGQRMMMYRPLESVLLGEFMLAALLSAPVQKVLADVSGGSTVGHVRVGDIRTLKIPVPPFREQTEIAQAYSRSDQRFQSEESLLLKLVAKKSGLMDDLLTGRVRVTSLLEDTE